MNGLKYFAWAQHGHLQLHAALEMGMSAGKGGSGAARMLDMLPALCACANHEGDEAKAGAQEFKGWASLKRQLTPPVGPLCCCAQGLGRSGRDHLKLLGLAGVLMHCR